MVLSPFQYGKNRTQNLFQIFSLLSTCFWMWCFHTAKSMHNLDYFVYVLAINVSTAFLLFRLHHLSHSIFTIILLFSTPKIKIIICCMQLVFTHLKLLVTLSAKLNILGTWFTCIFYFLLPNFSFSTALMPVSFPQRSLTLFSVCKTVIVLELSFSDPCMYL